MPLILLGWHTQSDGTTACRSLAVRAAKGTHQRQRLGASRAHNMKWVRLVPTSAALPRTIWTSSRVSRLWLAGAECATEAVGCGTQDWMPAAIKEAAPHDHRPVSRCLVSHHPFSSLCLTLVSARLGVPGDLLSQRRVALASLRARTRGSIRNDYLSMRPPCLGPLHDIRAPAAIGFCHQPVPRTPLFEARLLGEALGT